MPVVHDISGRMFSENICNNINKIISIMKILEFFPPPFSFLIIHTIGRACLAHDLGVSPLTLLQSQDLH